MPVVLTEPNYKGVPVLQNKFCVCETVTLLFSARLADIGVENSHGAPAVFVATNKSQMVFSNLVQVMVFFGIKHDVKADIEVVIVYRAIEFFR